MSLCTAAIVASVTRVSVWLDRDGWAIGPTPQTRSLFYIHLKGEPFFPHYRGSPFYIPLKSHPFFTNSAPSPIQSSCPVVLGCMCLSHRVKSSFTFIIFVTVFLIPFTKVESQINQLLKDSFGKSNKRTLVFEVAI